MDGIKSPEVRPAAIECHDSFLLQGYGVQELDIVHVTRGVVDEGRDGSSQIQQGVKLDGSFGLAERGPREERQAQIDRCGVQSIDRELQFDLQLFAPVERPGHRNEMIPEVLIDPVIPQFIGIRQGGAQHRTPEADVVELFVMRVQECLYVPQALTVCELRKGQAQQLVVAGEPPDPVIAVIAAHAFVILGTRQMLEELRKDRPS